MTTSPVLSITAELLDELQQKATAAIDDNLQYSNERCYDPRFGLTTVEQEFAVAANPATILALVEHIHSLTERLEQVNATLKRWDPIHYEIERRAGKTFDWDGCDFQVTIMAEDYAAIAQEGADHE